MLHKPERTPAGLATEIAQSYGSHMQLTEGFVNTVAIVDEAVVVKVPKRPGYRQLIDHEQQALKFIEHVNVAPYTTPRLVAYSPDPTYLVATYVPGRVFSAEEIQAFSTNERERLGRDLGSYILHQSKVGDAQEHAQLPTLREGGWPSTFDNCIGGFRHPRYPILTSLADKLYERWLSYCSEPRLDTATRRFIHGDLTPENMTLTEGRRLTGVIDFGRAHEGDINEELSCLANAGSSVLDACVKELQTNGIDADPEGAMLWRELKDFHVLPWWIFAGNTAHPNFQKWREVVVTRYPHLDWGELYT